MNDEIKKPEEITDVPLPELSQTVEVAPTLAQSAAAAGNLSGDELKNVVGGTPPEKPTESISLNFSKTHLEY